MDPHKAPGLTSAHLEFESRGGEALQVLVVLSL